MVVGATVAAFLLLDGGSVDRTRRVQSIEHSTPAARLRALREIVPFDEPAEDVAFDVTTSEGMLTPGPAGLDACIVARVPREALARWIDGWREISPDTALDLACAQGLAGQWSGFRLQAKQRDYRRADADTFDVSEQRTVFEGDGAIVWRIIR